MFDLPFRTIARNDMPLMTKRGGVALGYINQYEKTVRRNEGPMYVDDTFWFSFVYVTDE